MYEVQAQLFKYTVFTGLCDHILSDQENISLLGCDIIMSQHDYAEAQHCDTMSQHWTWQGGGGGGGGHPGNVPVNIRKLMPDGKWDSHPTPQNSSFSMFLEEREGRGLGGIFLNFIRIFGGPGVTM